MAAEGGNNIVRFIYTGADGEVIPWNVTHLTVRAKIIRERAFSGHRKIIEVICHSDVEKIEGGAFYKCRSLRRVIMPGVTVVEMGAFNFCTALTDVECGKLEIIKIGAFNRCKSLKSINLPSARIVESNAFSGCFVLTDVKFGSMLERFEKWAFSRCSSLERITIPLKDGMITADDIFTGCEQLKHVDVVDGELHETVAALQLEEWKNDMYEEIDSINQILPNTYAGGWGDDDADYYYDRGEKAQVIRRWIRSVLRKMINYKAEHQRILDEGVASALELALPPDTAMNSVLPFLELPPHTFVLELPLRTFEVEDESDEEEDDSEEDEEDEDIDDQKDENRHRFSCLRKIWPCPIR